MKALRTLFLIMMGLTVAFTLLGGIGTTCVAFGAERYESMAGLVPYKPLYQVLVAASLAVGLWGIPVTAGLARGAPRARRNALIVLLVGGAAVGIQVGVSQSVRGSAMPATIRLYANLLTLLLFLPLGLLGRRESAASDDRHGAEAEDGGGVGGVALIGSGALTLTTGMWTGLAHTSVDGFNWVAVLASPLYFVGWGLVTAGAAACLWAAIRPAMKHGRSGATPQGGLL
jgi:hypothetical protein